MFYFTCNHGLIYSELTSGETTQSRGFGVWGRDGTGSPGHGSPGQRFWPGGVGSRVSVSDSAFEPVLSFNMRAYRGVVSTE